MKTDSKIETIKIKTGNYLEMNNLQKRLIDIYLEWNNDHLTLNHIAEQYGIDPVDMDQLIHIGRKLQNKLEHTKKDY